MKTFRDAARSKDFAISAELILRPESNAASITAQSAVLAPHVDGILLTDNQAGSLHLAPLAAASILLASGVDPIVQFATRNRNRIALLADLLGAAALGVTSLHLVRGSLVPDGFSPRPKAVRDVNAAELLHMAGKLRDDEQLGNLPDFYIGGTVTPHRPKPGWVPEKLLEKADAGAQFLQTRLCMTPGLLTEYMQHLVHAGVPRRLSIFVTLAVFNSADDARWMRANRPNHRIPEGIVTRLEQSADAEQEGVRICAEQLSKIASIPGVSGAHLFATRNPDTIPAVIAAAGVGS
ncbi:MAG TPA: methylenetetrahydrofolate reductase [Woeseiaceae bacterium]|nr:methylenetetrahydrofolate reductase [Woeseiaceae bacterium]